MKQSINHLVILCSAVLVLTPLAVRAEQQQGEATGKNFPAIQHSYEHIEDTTVRALQGAIIDAGLNAIVYGHEGSTTNVMDNSVVYVYRHASTLLKSPNGAVFAYSGSTTIAQSGIVLCSGRSDESNSNYGDLYARVTASKSSVVHAEYGCSIEALSGAIVYANNARVVARRGSYIAASGNTHISAEKGAVIESYGKNVTIELTDNTKGT
ncbi:MAG: hypothetical protein IPM23_01655 [Candidatus Melainabacteria bacterium]|nr:hypothetical protein [Candidatus Melainabacteria bacterium]